MATVKALEARTVHQIQSGQVIVDLCSVVKELVENSLDAGATSIEVRFKGNGLESIEVQDNGDGIAKENYESIALKHYTSKLSSYDDLTSLQTFGFRGEALSSLCALSKFHIITARADEAPKGTRLDFEISGRLKRTQVTACQKGTTVAVEELFMNLPVRRQGLVRNIKREYGKVLGILQAYACISTQVRFSVSNVMAKGKKAVVFSTKSNQTTRENIANVYGTKALPGLVPLNLEFEMQPSTGTQASFAHSQNGKQVRVTGHVSRPVFGEGRQAPDRQMFFVNSRPCGLPQIAKVFNEIYRSFNLNQSPFVFANFVMDTNAYDVNVSPDKRTILLHDQGTLLECLKTSLIELFERQDHTVPQSQTLVQELPSYKPPTIRRESISIADSTGSSKRNGDPAEDPDASSEEGSQSTQKSNSRLETSWFGSLISEFAGRDTKERSKVMRKIDENGKVENGISKEKQRLVKELEKGSESVQLNDDYEDGRDPAASDASRKGLSIALRDFNQRLAEQQMGTGAPEALDCSPSSESDEDSIEYRPAAEKIHGVVPNAFERMRTRRIPPQTATITIGSKTTTANIGSSYLNPHKSSSTAHSTITKPKSRLRGSTQQRFSSSMRAFAAPGTQVMNDGDDQEETEQQIIEKLTDEDSRWAEELPHIAPIRELGSNDKTTPNDIEVNEDESVGESSDIPGNEGSDSEYVDEEKKRAREDARVALLIQKAEEKIARPSQDNIQRAQNILKGGQKYSTLNIKRSIETSIERITKSMRCLEATIEAGHETPMTTNPTPASTAKTPEERLSLTVLKDDFVRMRICGQFNLGFILAVRPSRPLSPSQPASSDELFIIDQHASDEKTNFERLQSTTVVQNQCLVHPLTLDLTAIEEELILEHNPILLRNGFSVSIDTSGDIPVGQRCKVLSLPMSREVTFSVSDLEELIALLADSPPQANSGLERIPRPSKVRRMFAMRACRSSVMVGKVLRMPQMEGLVRAMGTIEKPWNCPHGRPTMRHLVGLKAWRGWREGDGVAGLGEEGESVGVAWGNWVGEMRQGVGGKGQDRRRGEDYNQEIKGLEDQEVDDDMSVEEIHEEDEDALDVLRDMEGFRYTAASQ